MPEADINCYRQKGRLWQVQARHVYYNTKKRSMQHKIMLNYREYSEYFGKLEKAFKIKQEQHAVIFCRVGIVADALTAFKIAHVYHSYL